MSHTKQINVRLTERQYAFFQAHGGSQLVREMLDEEWEYLADKNGKLDENFAFQHGLTPYPTKNP